MIKLLLNYQKKGDLFTSHNILSDFQNLGFNVGIGAVAFGKQLAKIIQTHYKDTIVLVAGGGYGKTNVYKKIA